MRYTPAELARRWSANSDFGRRILAGPKRWIAGNADVLAGLTSPVRAA